LPPVSIGRRLIQLEGNETIPNENPYRIAPTTERVLAFGERTRELNKLEREKFSLIQKIADNKNYIENLAKKKLNLQEDRGGVISDIRQIRNVPHLPPHIVTSRRSPSPTSASVDVGEGAKKSHLGRLLGGDHKMPSRNVGQSVTLVPIMESIGSAISPVHKSKELSAFLTDLTPTVEPRTSRFKTPSVRQMQAEELLDDNRLKYLNSSKMNKETVHDFINTSRLMLRKNLKTESRKKDLIQVRKKYELEVEALKKAELDFEDEFQKFITMKADMENLNQVGSEQLSSKLHDVQELEKQIFLL